MSEADRLIARQHANPHAYLGAHPENGSVVIRTFRPAASKVEVVTADGTHEALECVHPGGVFEGHLKGAELPLTYQLEVDYGDSGHDHDRRPVPLPADDRRARRAPARRGPPRGAVGAPRRARDGDRRRHRDRVRGLGAVRPRGVGRRRLQLLGRPHPPDAHARLLRRLGAVPARRRRRRPLQVRDPRAGRRDPAEGRPGRVRDRAPAQDGLGRARPAARVGRRGVARGAAQSRSRSKARCRSTRSTSARGG